MCTSSNECPRDDRPVYGCHPKRSLYQLGQQHCSFIPSLEHGIVNSLPTSVAEPLRAIQEYINAETEMIQALKRKRVELEIARYRMEGREEPEKSVASRSHSSKPLVSVASLRGRASIIYKNRGDSYIVILLWQLSSSNLYHLPKQHCP